MNQPGQAWHGFGEATGRMASCPTCRKPLPRPDVGQLVLVCAHCRSETALAPAIESLDDRTFRIDLLVSESGAATMNSSHPLIAAPEHIIDKDEIDDDFEIRLEPESERVVPKPSLNEWQVNPAVSDQAFDRDRPLPTSTNVAAGVDFNTRAEQAKVAYNESSGLYPRERHYPTLEAMQRLYKLFGYVAVLMVFPYIGVRFLYLLVTTKERHLQVMAEFSEFAVPVLFGCVAFTASLFAASEGIKLAMDIQENTLRTANNAGRRKVN